MPFVNINNYIVNTLATDVSNYLNVKVNGFPNVANYYGGYGYFTEGTVRDVMFACLYNWLNNNENPAHVLLLSEVDYPEFHNRADLAVIYDNGAGPRSIYIELKADFNANSVDLDINLLDLVAGSMNSPLDDGYAFYVVRAGNTGWTNNIDGPTQPNVHALPINVV